MVSVADWLHVALTAEQACDLALEYGFNPVVNDEAAFDIYPEYVEMSICILES